MTITILNMNKKILISIIIIAILLIGALAFLGVRLSQANKANEEMVQLFELEKAEMENEYSTFATQYDEMQVLITNDSLVAQLEREKLRTQQLLEELRATKASNAAEIARLKKELKTVRTVMRSYVMQIDSLNRENMALKVDNDKLRNQNQRAQAHITDLSTEKEQLVEKVAIASQLNATNFSAIAHNKRGKDTEKISKAKKFVISFTLARNVTTQTGMRTIYVRIATPTGAILTSGGTFQYENRNLQYSISKEVEYTGEELPVTVYWDIAESLSAGEYRVDIFADGQNIGTTTFTMK